MIAVRRAFEVLQVCSHQHGGVPFNELRRKCSGVAATSLSRLLQGMVGEGILLKDEGGGYRIGSRFFVLAEEALGGRSVEGVLQPVLDALAAETEESAAYFHLDGQHMVLLAKSEQPDAFHYMDVLGRFGPLHRSAFGLACIGRMKLSERSSFLRDVPKGDTGAEEAFAMLGERGCVAREERIRTDVVRVVAPVLQGPGGQVVGTLGVTPLGPPLKVSESRRLEAAVKHAACTASEQMRFVKLK